MKEQQVVSGIKKIAIASVIMEYGLLQLVDNTKNDLKQRAKTAIASSKRIQDYFKFNPNVNGKFKNIFEKEFLKSEILLIAELFELLSGFDEEGLEVIIDAIKKSTNNEL